MASETLTESARSASEVTVAAIEDAAPILTDDLGNAAPSSDTIIGHLQRRHSSRKKHNNASSAAPMLRPDILLDNPSLRPQPIAGSGGSRRSKSYSFTENFSITETIADEAVSSLGMLDRQPAKLLALPQLVNSSADPYQPDTVDLSKDLKQQA
ncbi:hypothetical protein EV175_007534, partial [Coemansia sp. RSA 1933]